MSDAPPLARARADADAAKTQLLSTAHELQDRLKPATLANEAWTKIRAQTDSTARKAKRAVAREPVVAASAGVALILFLARRPIARLIARLRHTDTPPPAPKRASRPAKDDDR